MSQLLANQQQHQPNLHKIFFSFSKFLHFIYLHTHPHTHTHIKAYISLSILTIDIFFLQSNFFFIPGKYQFDFFFLKFLI